MTQAAPTTLADLRSEIDRIDSEMHALLMERSAIIETLIAVKKTQVSGSAFRPGREADMMKRLALRHKGLLPLDTIEGIWRIIIATFTYVQANYAVHADVSGGDAAMRDSARFHFGFTVPFVTHEDARAVIAAVADSAGDLGIFRMDQGASAGIWWRDLIGPDAAQDHRAAALHRAARPSRRHAGLLHRQAAGRCGGARDRALCRPRRALVGGAAAGLGQPSRRGLRQRRRRLASLAAGRRLRRGRPGRDPRRAGAGGPESTSPRSAATPPASPSNPPVREPMMSS